MQGKWTDRVNLSLASLPGMSVFEAMGNLVNKPIVDPVLGEIKLNHVQICPQNRNLINDSLIADIHSFFPETNFRLHANVQVLNRRIISDWVNYDTDTEYWDALILANNQLCGSGYSAHAGLKRHGSLNHMFDNVRRAQDRFQMPIAIEGMYPNRSQHYHISNWVGYRNLLDSQLNYALDLSHLYIVSTLCGGWESSLVQEMLSSEQCIEVHLSANDGQMDSHQMLTEQPVWWSDLDYANPNAVIFYEGFDPTYTR